MPNDKRPDPRFAMIALEMTCEIPAPATPQAPKTTPRGLLVNDGDITCPRCELGAFEPISSYVVCLGCPVPAPTYPLPDGVKLTTNLYCCSGCGKLTQVTMTMSDVNLHCGRCGNLSLHTRQFRSGEKRRPALADEKAISQASTPIDFRTEPTPSVIVDGVDDLLLPSDHPSLVTFTRALMSALRLEDFDEYAERIRRENMRNRCMITQRRTGRTWRGIVELLARHYFSMTRPTVWVVGGSESIDRWLRNEVIAFRNELGNLNPSRVEVAPPGSLVREKIAELATGKMKLPPGVMLLVDHTYYQRRGGPAVGYTYRA